jgi:hypothetical protein
MIEYESIPPETCMHCHRGETPHRDWHSTRAEYLKIGVEMTRRVRERADARPGARRLRRADAADAGERSGRRLAGLPGGAGRGVGRRRPRRSGAGAARGHASAPMPWGGRARRGPTAWTPSSGTTCGADRLRDGRDQDARADKFSCRARSTTTATRRWTSTRRRGLALPCLPHRRGRDRYVELSRSVKFPAAVQYLEERLGIRPPERRIHGVQIVRADGRR